MTDRQNNLLNRVAYVDIKNFQKGENLIDAIERSGYKELANELRKEKCFENYVVKDYVNNNKTNGFVAIAFEDKTTGEVGMSFRGTENLPQMGNDIKDILAGSDEALQNQIDMLDNAATAIAGDSSQAQDAIKFFEDNKVANGKNVLYGHSKGGELASEVFAKYYNEIDSIHIINPQPINWIKLTPEQREAFNSDKVDALVIDGDIVWLLGGVPYKVRICENNDSDPTFFGPHGLESAKYDENGNAIIEDDPYANYTSQAVIGSIAMMLMIDLQRDYAIIVGTYELLKDGYNFVVNEITELAGKVKAALVEKCKEISEFIKDGYETVKSNLNKFVAKAVKHIDNWLKSKFNSSSANPIPQQIKLDTYKLKLYAQRIDSVNKRISKLDRRLDGLYWRVGLLGLWNLIQADALTGYSWRLKRCADYLNTTANNFDSVEKRLNNSL